MAEQGFFKTINYYVVWEFLTSLSRSILKVSLNFSILRVPSFAVDRDRSRMIGCERD
jgi:hypothetical protein